MLSYLGDGTRARRTFLFVAALAALAAVAAVVAFSVAATREDVYTSTAKVGFVEDLRFDYVDAERDRLIGHAEGAEGQALVAADGIADVEYVRPPRQTFFDVIVQAESPELAASTANQLAELIVAGDREFELEQVELELRALRAQVGDLELEANELGALIDEQSRREAFAEGGRFNNGPEALQLLTIELRDAQDQRLLATRFRNQVDSIRLDALERIRELEVAKAATLANIRVTRPALPSDSPTSIGPATTAYAVALLVLAFALTVLLLASPYQSAAGDSA